MVNKCMPFIKHKNHDKWHKKTDKFPRFHKNKKSARGFPRTPSKTSEHAEIIPHQKQRKLSLSQQRHEQA